MNPGSLRSNNRSTWLLAAGAVSCAAAAAAAAVAAAAASSLALKSINDLEFIMDALFVEIESEDDCCCCSFGSVRGLDDAPVVEEGSGEGVGLGLGGGGAELFATIIGLFTLSSLLSFSSLFCVWLISWSDLDKMSLKNVSFSFRIADGAGSLYSSNECEFNSLYLY